MPQTETYNNPFPGTIRLYQKFTQIPRPLIEAPENGYFWVASPDSMHKAQLVKAGSHYGRNALDEGLAYGTEDEAVKRSEAMLRIEYV